MAEPAADHIRQKLAALADPTIQTHETDGRRVTRHNPADLTRAAADLEAHAARQTGPGIMRPVRLNHPRA